MLNATQRRVIALATCVLCALLVGPLMFIWLTRASSDAGLAAFLLAMVFMIVGVWAGYNLFASLVAANSEPVPRGYAGIISRKQRRLMTVLGPAELKCNKLNEEVITTVDLRDRLQIFDDTFVTVDRLPVALKVAAIWKVMDVHRWLDYSQKPDELPDIIIRSCVVDCVGRRKGEDLSGNLAVIGREVCYDACARLARYGIFVVAVHIRHLQLPEKKSDKSDADREAERIRKVHEATREASERTLEHIEKMEQARSGVAR